MRRFWRAAHGVHNAGGGATIASASIGAEGIVTLVEGSAFCISNRSGEIDPSRPQGLFFRDTRFISELRCTLNGLTPEPLAATAREWAERLRRDPDQFPRTLQGFLERCHEAGQRRPTPLLLRYTTGDWNALHQDLGWFWYYWLFTTESVDGVRFICS